MALGSAASDQNFQGDQSPVSSAEVTLQADVQSVHPLISLVIPAYNEAPILERNLSQLCEYLMHLPECFSWEIVLINDGSRDETGTLADRFAAHHPGVRVVHHPRNYGLGQALRTGFAATQGRYVITLDLDLSYAPAHIESLIHQMEKTGAKIVIASPYMSGGRVSNVPPLRRWLSIWANRWLSLAAKREISTLTGMVRAYDGAFVRSLHPRASGMDINPELLHKARLLKAPIEEIPAHLHWLPLGPCHAPSRKRSKSRLKSSTAKDSANLPSPQRSSSMKILRQVWSVLFYGFAFRPVVFFLIPSFLFLLLGAGTLVWAMAQQQHFAWIIGAMVFLMGFQLLSSAALAAQNKFYFEELFSLGSDLGKSPDSVI